VAKDFAFTPGTMTVPVGTTVTWQIDQPDAPHNVVSLDGPTSFNSGVPVGRGTFHYTFAQVGTWTYTCLVHPSMKGTVIVSP
jgi:plastocyanin